MEFISNLRFLILNLSFYGAAAIFGERHEMIYCFGFLKGFKRCISKLTIIGAKTLSEPMLEYC